VGAGALGKRGNGHLHLVALDRLGGGGADLLGSGGSHAGGRLGTRLGEHACFADEAGGDDGDADAAGGEVRSQAEGEAAQAELGGVVDRGARAGGLAGERGDEDEVAGTRLQHRRVEGAGHQHRRLEVDPQRPLHLLGTEVGEKAGAR
jgi:hypothetical protein